MTDTDRMVVWLREALDAAEEVADAAREGGEGRWQQPDPERMPGFIVGDHEGYHVAYDEGYPTLEQAAHIVLHDPAAVLRRIAADRELLDLHADDGYGECKTCSVPDGTVEVNGIEYEMLAHAPAPCATVRLLAEGWGWTEEEQR